MTSPTQRTNAYLRKEGYTVATVEKWNQFAHIRRDLFGIIDVLAIREGEILGVQATTGAHVAARITKALAEPKLERWLMAGGHFEVWGWRKTGARGKRKLWSLRRVQLVMARGGEIEAFELPAN